MYLFQPTALISMHQLRINLHSTMYLFQHRCICDKRRDYIIYIPLCIYFNFRRRSFWRWRLWIYIPLCIYFNKTTHIITLKTSSFTFHYVSISTAKRIVISQIKSIYIPLCIYFNAVFFDISTFSCSFTFHYVSISTIFDDGTMYISLSFTFHYVSISTQNNISQPTLYDIYIPLCIYFNTE